MARQPKRRATPATYAIIGDGLTEKLYFEKLAAMRSIQNIKVKPDLPSGTGGDYAKIFKREKELLQVGYDHVHCMIDYDTIVQQKRTQNFAADSTRFISDYHNRVTVYVNNPCFEIWFLLHYERTTKPFASCDEAIAALRKHIRDYRKQQEYLNKLYADIQLDLILSAVSNAKALEQNRSMHGEYYPRAEVYKLVETLFLHQI